MWRIDQFIINIADENVKDDRKCMKENPKIKTERRRKQIRDEIKLKRLRCKINLL
jgi:type III secretory pathway component EscU